MSVKFELIATTKIICDKRHLEEQGIRHDLFGKSGSKFHVFKQVGYSRVLQLPG